MDAGCARREPAWQGYHTGSPAAGRESAARAMCSIQTDVSRAIQVASQAKNLVTQCAYGDAFARNSSTTLLRLNRTSHQTPIAAGTLQRTPNKTLTAGDVWSSFGTELRMSEGSI